MKIGITAQISHHDLNTFDMDGAEFPQSIIDICQAQGILPLVFPITQSTTLIKAMLKTVNGIIITGGGDVCSDIYGAKPVSYQRIRSMPDYYRPRDIFEIKLIHLARQMGVPVLGLCRGIQIINVALGGTLYQDIQTQLKNRQHPVQHFQHLASDQATHSVSIKPGSLLYQSVGKTLRVNSYHHQAVHRVGHHLHIVAKAPDGVIEGLESDHHLFQGIQWHPEQMWQTDPRQRKIFTDFFKRILEYDLN